MAKNPLKTRRTLISTKSEKLNCLCLFFFFASTERLLVLNRCLLRPLLNQKKRNKTKKEEKAVKTHPILLIFASYTAFHIDNLHFYWIRITQIIPRLGMRVAFTTIKLKFQIFASSPCFASLVIFYFLTLVQIDWFYYQFQCCQIIWHLMRQIGDEETPKSANDKKPWKTPKILFLLFTCPGLREW